MRPSYLEFCGINSFSEKAVIDFKRLSAGGIFGIFGDTGAGKSTILDCIGFALYGKVNRVGKDGAYLSDVINYKSDKAYVYFEFEAEIEGAKRLYRVERNISRTRPPKAVLYLKDGGEWKTVCDGAAQTNKILEEEIVGIRFDDFKKCIALPQGEFSQFLQSTRKDRLTLIAKLFSLEQYGFLLAQKIKNRLDGKNTEFALLSGKLSGFEGISEERLGELSREIAEAEEKRLRTAKELREVEDKLKAREELLKQKRDLQAAKSVYECLNAKRAETEEKRASIEKTRLAVRICELHDELRTVSGNYTASDAKARDFREREAALVRDLQSWKDEDAARDTQGELVALQEKKAHAEAARSEIGKLEEAKQKLFAARETYKAHAAKGREFFGFDYATEKKKEELLLAALPPENDLLEYIGDKFKPLLLQDEYAKFAGELTALKEKYPVIGPDADPLIDRYTSIGAAGGVDFVKQAEYFRKCTAEKERIRKRLTELDVKNVRFSAFKEEEERLKKEGEQLKAEYREREESLREVLAFGTPEKLTESIGKLLKDREQRLADYDRMRERLTGVKSTLAAEEALCEKYAAEAEKLRKKISETLAEGGMPDVTVAESYLKKYGDPERMLRETEEYFRKLYAAEEKYKELAAAYKDVPGATEDEISAFSAERENAKAELMKREGELAVKRSEKERVEARLTEKKELEKEEKRIRTEIGTLEKLKELVAKDKFMEFVAVEYLQEMASNANNLLLKLTGGRYFLLYDKNFEVGDNFNGGKTRGTHTLSGGETFLVSLSLALSLSESIHRRSLRPAEFFFLDEGFGTLDDELVDTVMDSLEKLKSENFAIGIISHVGELKNRLENKIIVEKANGERGSVVRAY